MSLLHLYLNGVPLGIVLVYLLLRFTVLRGKTYPGLSETDMAWCWFINYSLANLYFVWTWDYVYSWRTGQLLLSTGIVVLCTAGQVFCSVLALRKRGNRLLVGLCLLTLLFVNLPISVTVIWRKSLDLPLS